MPPGGNSQLIEKAQSPFAVSLISNTEPSGLLCKVYKYDKATREAIAETNAFLSEGHVVERSFTSIAAFMEFRSMLSKNQALMMGRPLYQEARIVTQAVLAGMSHEQRGADRIIARDRDHVSWSDGPALVMIDLDNPDRFPALVRQQLPNDPGSWRRLLIECIPVLSKVPMGWAPSSSSYVYHRNREVRGLGGQRFYFVIQSGQDIPRFAEALHYALVLRGLVWFEVSKSGSLLKRLPFDFAVYRPEHLDFAAGPKCVRPLTWCPPEPQIWNDAGPYLRASDLPPTSKEDRTRIDATLMEAKRAKQHEAQACREEWVTRMGRSIARRARMKPEQAARVAEAAIDGGVLFQEFVLQDEHGKKISVGELLQNPKKYHGKRFCDPLEPDYRNDHRVAVFLVDDRGNARIHSHAHGGQVWRCQRVVPTIRAELTHVTVDGITRGLGQDTCELYRSGDAVVCVNEEEARISSLSTEGLALRLQRRFPVVRAKKGKDVPANLPATSMKALMSVAPTLSIPRLSAVVQGPYALADGTVVDAPGYHAGSEVMYVAASLSPPGIRRNLDKAQLREAFQRLWHPVHRFPLKTDIDRGVLLAAMFSALMRPSLPIAPGYYITANTAGTGKTLLAQVLGTLQTGFPVAASPFPRDEEERRKHLFAALREGAPFLLYDNTERGVIVDSPVLANLLTSPLVEGRVLGVSSVERRPNRMTVILTGNNLTLRGDLNRRILPVTLDAGVERPWEREFPFHPVNFTLANWLALRIAGLEVVQAWNEAGAPQAQGVSGFPEWDASARSIVVWVAKELNTGLAFADPIESIRQSYLDDPEADSLGNLLEAWYDVFGAQEVRVKDIEEVSQAVGGVSEDETDESAARRRLIEARMVILSHMGDRETSYGQRLGIYLKQQEGRIVRGRRLERCGKSAGTRKYRVVSVGEQLQSGERPNSAQQESAA